VSVYVDPIAEWGGSDTFHWKRSCHMFADTLDELHAMALRIGMKLEWFQDEQLKHYDLVGTARRRAVAAGALEVSFREMVSFMKHGTRPVSEQQQMDFEVTNPPRRTYGRTEGVLREGCSGNLLQSPGVTPAACVTTPPAEQFTKGYREQEYHGKEARRDL